MTRAPGQALEVPGNKRQEALMVGFECVARGDEGGFSRRTVAASRTIVPAQTKVLTANSGRR